MTSDELTVLVVLVIMMMALASRRVSPAVGICGGLAALFFFDVVSSAQVLAGFSSEAPATIAALYVVAGAVERSGALSPVSGRVLVFGAPTSSLARLTAMCAALSALVANTPIVAMMTGPVTRWARRSGEAPSRYLIPLSYAAILGGMPTLIGTSTNLVASGLAADLGQEAFGLLEPARMGLPVALAGLVIVIVLSRRLLPERGDGATGSAARPFTVALRVIPRGALAGRSVADAGLRELGSTYLVGVERGGDIISPVRPGQLLCDGDRLTFSGQVDDVVSLERLPGLELVEGAEVGALEDGQHGWFEAVIGAASPLVGKTIKQTGFRGRYQAAVVAIHRSGQGIDTQLGSTRLQIGDCLLLVAEDGFASRWRKGTDFLLIQRRQEPPPAASKARLRSLLALAGVVVATLAGIGVFKAALLGAAATIASGAQSPRQARDSVDINVVVLVAAAIGLGSGVQASGLAVRLADALVEGMGSLGVWGVAFGLVVATLFLTEIVTNAGAVALMVPLAVRVAADVGSDPRSFVLGVAVAASASFLTPIGYQTNTMVYGPGRYHFGDYLRLGLPITAVVMVLVPTMMAAERGLW